MIWRTKGGPRGSVRRSWLIARTLVITAFGVVAVGGCATDSSRAAGPAAGNSSSGSSLHSPESTSPPTPTANPPITNPTSPGITSSGTELPYTVVATDGPFIGNGVVAATDMSKLLALLNARTYGRVNEICPSGGCFTGARPPNDSMLIEFNAVSGSCQTPTSYAARLTDPHTLRIDVSASDRCGTGAGMLAEAPDVLIAIPLDRLPATGRLAVVVYPYGSGFGGLPETGSAVR